MDYNIKRKVLEPKTEIEKFMDFVVQKEKELDIEIDYAVESQNGKILTVNTKTKILNDWLISIGFSNI
tara:strand:+ start:745 stop:948 length:204 start_codon:yes stop_codon:yes gene_type:complete